MNVSAAEYLANSASPTQSPLASHHGRAERPSPAAHGPGTSAAPSRAASKGPSGSTQPPVVTPNTGARLSVTAAHSPARGRVERRREPVDQPGGQPEQRDEGQPHDQRRVAAGQPARAPGQPPRGRRVVEIAEPQLAPGRHHVALVHAEAERQAEQDAQRAGGQDQQQHERCVVRPPH